MEINVEEVVWEEDVGSGADREVVGHEGGGSGERQLVTTTHRVETSVGPRQRRHETAGSRRRATLITTRSCYCW